MFLYRPHCHYDYDGEGYYISETRFGLSHRLVMRGVGVTKPLVSKIGHSNTLASK